MSLSEENLVVGEEEFEIDVEVVGNNIVSSDSNTSVEIDLLHDRADKLSDDIKKLSIGVEDNSEMSSSVIEDHEDVTIMEKALENEKKSECIFEEVDGTDTGHFDNVIHQNKLEQKIDLMPLKSYSEDSIKEEKSKKSISFNLPEDQRGSNSSFADEDENAMMDDNDSISSEATVTDNIPNLISGDLQPEIMDQKAKIERKAKKLIEMIGNVPKQKYFDDRDGRKDGVNTRDKNRTQELEKPSSKLPVYNQKAVFRYPDVLRPESSRGRHFWQMPFREKLYHETLNPAKPEFSDSEEEDVEIDVVDEEDPVILSQDDLDPKYFAPTGDIYSYFQRRRLYPFRFSNPLTYSTRKCLGGKIGAGFVY